MFVIVKPDGTYWSGFAARDDLASAVHCADIEQTQQIIQNLVDNGIDATGYRIIFDPLPWPERLAAYRAKCREQGLSA